MDHKMRRNVGSQTNRQNLFYLWVCLRTLETLWGFIGSLCPSRAADVMDHLDMMSPHQQSLGVTNDLNRYKWTLFVFCGNFLRGLPWGTPIGEESHLKTVTTNLESIKKPNVLSVNKDLNFSVVDSVVAPVAILEKRWTRKQGQLWVRGRTESRFFTCTLSSLE